MPQEIASGSQTMRREVIEGLSRPQKRLPSKYFYDERGSELFEHITRLEEYYLTRTEWSILEDHGGDMARRIGARAALVELGSGSSRKTRLLLDRLPDLQAYVPVDISSDYLRKVSRELRREYPGLSVRPVCADYTTHFELPDLPGETERLAFFFPGSTIGNYKPTRAQAILARIAGLMKAGGLLLIGVDLKKDPRVLEAAYNDRKGVTSAFNRNILRHLNRELEGNFNPSGFEHLAFYNPEKGRIEMHLVSRKRQKVQVAGRTFELEEGETIHTENSHKYTLEEFRRLVKDRFHIEKVWTDRRDWFSLQLLKKIDDSS
ncbi:MAG: L-histidine N(alpha)-methyltransferase [Balneolaceae bacterium]|nr:L-histidine N(alpha)-methyltransferase [Balneolaceae bacterium]